MSWWSSLLRLLEDLVAWLEGVLGMVSNAYPTSWNKILQPPFVTVSSGPTSTTGASYGSDTVNPSTGLPTTTGGQAEADAFLASQGGGLAVLENGQALVITPTAGNSFASPYNLGGGGGSLNPSGTVAALVVGGAGSAGSAATYSRGDHVHPLPAANESNYVANDDSGGLVGIINADSSAATISASKAPGSGGTPSGTVGTLVVGGSGTAGSSSDYSRGDHVHPMPSANESRYVANDDSGNLASILNADTSGVQISAAVAPGTGATYSGTVTTLVVGGSGTAGSAATSSRGDHVHPLPAANESNYVANDNTGHLVGVLNADTSGATISAAVAPGTGATYSGTVATLVVGGSGTAGSAATSSRGDHVHPLPAANESNYVANDNTGNIVDIINADSSAATISAAKAPGSGGSPSGTTSSGTSYGVANNAGSASTFSRGDHQHGTVGHDDIGNLTGSGFSGGQYAQWSSGSSKFVPASGTVSFTALAGPSGESLTYTLYYTGSNYNMVNFNTGVTDYTSTTAAGALTNLATVMNNGTTTYPVTVKLSPEVDLAGQLSLYGSAWTLTTDHPSIGAGSARPYIGQITIGVSGQSATIEGWYINGVATGEIDCFNYDAVINKGIINNVTYLTTGASGRQGFVVDCSLGSSSNYVDYVAHTGYTIFSHGNSTGSASGSYPGGVITFKGTANGTDQFPFEQITLTNTSGQSGSCYVVNLMDSALTGRLQCKDIEINWNGAQTANYIVWLGAGSSGITNYGIICKQLSIENHTPSAGTCALVGMGVNTGGVTSSFIVENLLVTYCSEVPVTLFNDAGTTFNSNPTLPFLRIGSIGSSYAGGGSGTWVSWGVYVERAGAPVYVGTAYYGSGTPAGIASGSYLSTPVTSSGSVLSVGGTGSLVNNTTYTVGGTPLVASITGGTVTVTSPDGTTRYSAATIVGDVQLPPKTTVAFSTVADVKILKAV